MIETNDDQSLLVLANELDARAEAWDLTCSKDIGEALFNAYPGHSWGVRVQSHQGIATIHNLSLSGEWGFVLHLDKAFSASELRRKAIMAGGEILERFKVARGKAVQDALASMSTDFTGRVLGDLSK